MKWLRLLARIVLISLVAAVCILFTARYASSLRADPRYPLRYAARENHRPDAPDASGLPEFIGQGMLVALFAVVGRVFRLRLSTSRNENRMISLALDRTRPAQRE